MKNRIITIGIALLMAAGFSSCKKEESEPVYYKSPSYNAISNGKWIVASFEMNGVEHNDFYTPYMFNFKSGGLIMVTGTGRETLGTWSIKTANDYQSMQINFSQEPFDLLSSPNWKIISMSSSRIEMKGTRGDDGTQVLILQKI